VSHGRRPSRAADELTRVNAAARTSQHTKAPVNGVTGSNQAMKADLDALFNYGHTLAGKWRVQAADIFADMLRRAKGNA